MHETIDWWNKINYCYKLYPIIWSIEQNKTIQIWSIQIYLTLIDSSAIFKVASF